MTPSVEIIIQCIEHPDYEPGDKMDLKYLRQCKFQYCRREDFRPEPFTTELAYTAMRNFFKRRGLSDSPQLYRDLVVFGPHLSLGGGEWKELESYTKLPDGTVTTQLIMTKDELAALEEAKQVAIHVETPEMSEDRQRAVQTIELHNLRQERIKNDKPNRKQRRRADAKRRKLRRKSQKKARRANR